MQKFILSSYICALTCACTSPVEDAETALSEAYIYSRDFDVPLCFAGQYPTMIFELRNPTLGSADVGFSSDMLSEPVERSLSRRSTIMVAVELDALHNGESTENGTLAVRASNSVQVELLNATCKTSPDNLPTATFTSEGRVLELSPNCHTGETHVLELSFWFNIISLQPCDISIAMNGRFIKNGEQKGMHADLEPFQLECASNQDPMVDGNFFTRTIHAPIHPGLDGSNWQRVVCEHSVCTDIKVMENYCCPTEHLENCLDDNQAL